MAATKGQWKYDPDKKELFWTADTSNSEGNKLTFLLSAQHLPGRVFIEYQFLLSHQDLIPESLRKKRISYTETEDRIKTKITLWDAMEKTWSQRQRAWFNRHYRPGLFPVVVAL